jgi:hypothetical protein
VDGVRHERGGGTRREVRGARGARRVWCDRARREVQRRTARGGSVPSVRTDVLTGALPVQ